MNKDPASSINQRSGQGSTQIGQADQIIINQKPEPKEGPIKSDLPFFYPRIATFKGRKKLISTITNRIQKKGHRFITLYGGIGGVGKTALARKVAEQFEENDIFPDGIHFIDLEETDTTEGLIVKTKTELKMSSVRGEEELLRSICRKNILLIYDNLEPGLDRDAEKLNSFLRRLHNFTSVTLLCTCRRDIGITEEAPVEVKQLSKAEAKRLFLSLLLLKGIARPDKDQLKNLLKFFDGIPQVIIFAIACLSDLSISEYLERVRQDTSILLKKPGVSGDGDRTSNYVISMNITYRMLSPESQRLFRYISILPSVASSKLFADCNFSNMATLISELERRQLVESEDDEIRMLMPIKEAIRKLSDIDEDINSSEEINFIADSAFNYFQEHLLDEGFDELAINQYGNLTFTIQSLIEAGCYSDDLERLLIKTTKIYMRNGLLDESIALLQTANDNLDNIPYEVHLLFADALRLKDQYRDSIAFYMRALKNLPKPISDDIFSTESLEKEADARFGLANVLRNAQHYLEARHSFSKASALYERIPDSHYDQAKCIWGLASILFATSRWQNALETYQSVIEQFDDLDSPQSQIVKIDCLKGICDVYLKQRQYDLALKAIEDADTMFNGASRLRLNRFVRAKIDIGFGDVYRLMNVEAYIQGNKREQYFERAAKAYESASSFYGESMAPFGEALCLYKYGELLALKDLEKSNLYFEESLQIFKRCKNSLGESKASLARLKLDLIGNVIKKSHYTQAGILVEILTRCNSKYWRAEALLVQSACAIKIGYSKKGKELIDEAAIIYQKLGRNDKEEIMQNILMCKYTLMEAFRE